MLVKFLVTTLAALALTAPAEAATPPEATRQIQHCLRDAGAVAFTHTHGYTAHFGGRRDASGRRRWVYWSVFELDADGQVAGLLTSSSWFPRAQTRRINRCLRPFGGSI
jgi:hypothetical protein